MTLRKVLLNLKEDDDEEAGIIGSDNIMELVPEETIDFCESIMKRNKEMDFFGSFIELRSICEHETKDIAKVDDLFFRFMLRNIKVCFERLSQWEKSPDIGTNEEVENFKVDISENLKTKITKKRKEEGTEDTVESEIENNVEKLQIDQLFPPFFLMYNTINTEIPNINARWALELGEELVPGGVTRDKNGYLIRNWQPDVYLAWYDDLRSHRVLTKRAVRMLRQYFPSLNSILTHLESSQQQNQGAISDRFRVLRIDTFEQFKEKEKEINPFFVYYFGMMMMMNVVFREMAEEVEKGDLIERLWQIGRNEFAATVTRRAILTNTLGSYRFAYLINKLSSICMYFTLALSMGLDGYYTMDQVNDKVSHSGKWEEFTNTMYFKERLKEAIDMLAWRTVEEKTNDANNKEVTIGLRNNYKELGLNTLISQLKYETTEANNSLIHLQKRPNNYNLWHPFVSLRYGYFDLMYETVIEKAMGIGISERSVVISLNLPIGEFKEAWSKGQLDGNLTKSDFRQNKDRLYLLEYAYLKTLINNKRNMSQFLVYPLREPIRDDIFNIKQRGWNRLTELNMIVDQMKTLFEDRGSLTIFNDIKGKIECQRVEVALRIVCPSLYNGARVFGIEDTSQFSSNNYNQQIAIPLQNEDLVKIMKRLEKHDVFSNSKRGEKLHSPLSSVVVAAILSDTDNSTDLFSLLGIDKDVDGFLFEFYVRFCLLDNLIAYLIGEKEEEAKMLENPRVYTFQEDDNSIVFTAISVFENLVGIYI